MQADDFSLHILLVNTQQKKVKPETTPLSLTISESATT
jgi:hypothetical protein